VISARPAKVLRLRSRIVSIMMRAVYLAFRSSFSKLSGMWQYLKLVLTHRAAGVVSQTPSTDHNRHFSARRQPSQVILDAYRRRTRTHLRDQPSGASDSGNGISNCSNYRIRPIHVHVVATVRDQNLFAVLRKKPHPCLQDPVVFFKLGPLLR